MRSGPSQAWGTGIMGDGDIVRRTKLVRELEQDFVADYDANNLPAADKRAAYALEHIAFRLGRIEQTLSRLAHAIESTLLKP